MVLELWIFGLGFGVWSKGLSIQDLGSRVKGSGLRIKD